MLHYLIRFIHLVLILFVLVVPFTGNIKLLYEHVIIVPFLLAHWLTNSDHCMLTYLERITRDVLTNDPKETDCVTCQIIEPVFNITSSKQQNNIIYVITTILWFISFSKVYKNLKSKNHISFF